MKDLKQKVTSLWITTFRCRLLVCENVMKSEFMGVQSFNCSWDHVADDHSRRISQNVCNISIGKKKPCSLMSCTSVYSQNQFLDRVGLPHCSADSFLFVQPHLRGYVEQ